MKIKDIIGIYYREYCIAEQEELASNEDVIELSKRLIAKIWKLTRY